MPLRVRVGNRPEPLLCVLNTVRCNRSSERRLAAGRYKASGLLTDEGLTRSRGSTSASLRALDPELRGLANINEPPRLSVGVPSGSAVTRLIR